MTAYDFVIQKMIINGNEVWHVAVRPPMNNSEYDAMKYHIEKLGGHWRERFGGFIFTEDPSNIDFNLALTTPINQNAYRQWQISRQFYPTPSNIAQRVVDLAEISSCDVVLEPSAGRGALLMPLPKVKDTIVVEIDKNNADFLTSLGFNVFNVPFEQAYDMDMISGVTRVVMNPPFSHQRDIKHILLAYELLEKDGILVAIMSENDLYYDTTLTKEFNAFLKEHNAYIEEIPMRGFMESQTSVDTIIVKIKKH